MSTIFNIRGFASCLTEIMSGSVMLISLLLLSLLLLAGQNSLLLAAPEAAKNPSNNPATAAAFTANWPKAYFRGTPNNWGTTEMALVTNNLWETIQDFTGQTDPRFKIDRFANWHESYPAQDYRIAAPGQYRIQFNDSSRSVTVTRVDSSWTSACFRGTPNQWACAPMNKAGDNLWEIIVDFTGQTNPRFKIDRQGDWSESYPAQDYLVQAKKYKILFNDQTKAITLDSPGPVITATPEPGEFKDPQKVTLESSNPNDRIYYTTDGSTPTAASTLYKEPINIVMGRTTIKAIGIDRNNVAGQDYTFAYNINPIEITVSPPCGSYSAPISMTFTITDNKASVKAYYTTENRKATPADTPYLSGTPISVAKTTSFNLLAVDADGNSTNKDCSFEIGSRADFRRETIYFVITSRFYDGDPDNNTYCWDDQAAGNRKNNDPCWRGDFKGLIQKLDYIKALGFSAIWITPVVKNMSGYDYHGYHAVNHKEIDPRNLSADTSYKDLIDAAHAKGIKIIQDIVFNHTSNFGEENLYPLFKKDPAKPDIPANLINIAPPGKLPANYDSLNPGQQYQARIAAMKEDATDTQHVYHHEKSLCWECYQVQTGQIAGDCVDLNTENPLTYQYLIDAYNQYIDMGVDAFRVDTIKHISRLTFNKAFLPALVQRGGEDFYIFGELASRFRQVWNHDIPAISTPFYTWKESKGYPWSATDRLVNEKSTPQNYNDNSTVTNQPSSDNHLLRNNTYRKPDWSRRSYLDVIDFPMHWNFNNAHDAFRVAVGNDQDYNDATWNVTYVDSHDYAPDGAPEDKRFSGSQATWAENLSLIFTFRGIPTIYYGSEIEFKKGFPIDKGPTAPLEETGRAYFGDRITGAVAVSDFGIYSNATGNLATTLNHPLAQHIRRLNLIRRAVPALQRGQYSTENISGSELAFKRRYTDATTDSMALVTVSGDATFNGIPNGTYKDVITGDVKVVNNGSLSISGCNGQGNMRVYVLDTALTQAPGKVGEAGAYLN